MTDVVQTTKDALEKVNADVAKAKAFYQDHRFYAGAIALLVLEILGFLAYKVL